MAGRVRAILTPGAVAGLALGVALGVALGLPEGAAGQQAPVGQQAPRPTTALASGDTVALSLAQAVGLALEKSEEIRLARAQVDAARAQVGSARSAMLPQINTQVTYTKTLRSVFQNQGFEIPDSLRFEPDSMASVLQRLSYLENHSENAALGALGGLFGNLPFGRENTWLAGATFNQPIFAGGRLSSAVKMAGHGATAAEAGLEEARANVDADVRQAYFDARLAQESADIVAKSVELARQHLEHVQLLLENGRASELDVLRSQVELDNLGPQLVQARNARDVAVLNLKRLVNLPMDAPVRLTTGLEPAESGMPAPEAVHFPSLAEASDRLARRASLRAAEETVGMRREQVDIARAAFLPSIALTGTFARQAYPGRILPSGGDWRDDWNVGFSVQWPLFQGLRRNAELDAAHAELVRAELQRDQLGEALRLEYERALGELERARAQISAAARTSGQAQRVYDLTQLRFDQGLATQLDVSDARLALQQARINEVQAYHDYYLAVTQARRALGEAPGAAGAPVDRGLERPQGRER